MKNRFFWKIALVLIFVVFCAGNTFAQYVNVVIEIANVRVNDGKVFVFIFFNAEELRAGNPSVIRLLDSTHSVISQEVAVPAGEYVIISFQDHNGNNDLDLGGIGIPVELFGMSNYNGRGFPSRYFNGHKVPFTAATGKITIGLFRI